MPASSVEGPHPGWAYFLQPHKAEDTRELSGMCFVRTLIAFIRFLPSWPNHLSKTLPPNITMGIRFQHVNFGGHKHSDHRVCPQRNVMKCITLYRKILINVHLLHICESIYSQETLLFISIFSASNLTSWILKILKNICCTNLLKKNSLVLCCWIYDSWLHSILCLPTLQIFFV